MRGGESGTACRNAVQCGGRPAAIQCTAMDSFPSDQCPMLWERSAAGQNTVQSQRVHTQTLPAQARAACRRACRRWRSAPAQRAQHGSAGVSRGRGNNAWQQGSMHSSMGGRRVCLHVRCASHAWQVQPQSTARNVWSDTQRGQHRPHLLGGGHARQPKVGDLMVTRASKGCK